MTTPKPAYQMDSSAHADDPKAPRQDPGQAKRGPAVMSRADLAWLESVASPMSITNRSTGEVLFSNDAARKLFERADDDHGPARNCYVDLNARSHLVRDIEEFGQVANREIEFISRQGRHFWGLISASLVEVDGVPAILASIVDISAQKSREAQLGQATEQVRAQAAETQLLNRELQRQQQVAISANRAKSDFLARMSHELRSPLNAILGFSEVISGNMLGETEMSRYQGYAGDIHEAGAHLLALINDILDLSKVEAGRLELNFEPLDLRELVQSCLPLTTPLAERRGVKMRAEFDASSLKVEADALRLRQVVLNILSNAVKFTLAGGEVVLSLREISDEIELECADTGIGMSPEQLEVALQPFGQVVTESPYAQVGTGLGLPIVVSLIELHNGRFSIQSHPNVGTRVTIRLPKQQKRA